MLASRSAGFALLGAFFATASTVHAATWTWDGGGTDNNWSTPRNWDYCSSFDLCPLLLGDGDSLDFAGTQRPMPFNDLSLSLDSIRFSSGGFTLLGNPLFMRSAFTNGVASISNRSGGTQTINNNISFFGAGRISGGGMTFNGSISQNTSLSVNSDARETLFNGNIAGSGSLTISSFGAGAVVFGAENTYTGATHVTSGSTLRLRRNNAVPLASTLAIDGTFDMNGFSQTLSRLQGSGGTLQLGSGTVRIEGGSFAGTISGTTGKVVKTGLGRLDLTLSGASYTGGTEVLGGVLNASGLPDSGPVLVQGGTLSVGNEAVGAVTLNGGEITGGMLLGTSFDVTSGNVLASLAGTATLRKTGAGTVTLSGANTYAGGTLVSGGTLLVSGSLPLNRDVTVQSAATLTTTRAGTIGFLSLSGGFVNATDLAAAAVHATAGSINGRLVGAGSLSKNGPGTLFLGGSHAYTGGTTVVGGVLALTSSNALPVGGGLVLHSGTVLDMNGFSQTVGALNGAGNVRLEGATLAVNGSGLYQGQLFGPGGLHKAGSGTLTLAGRNDYTGQTEVSGGTLALGVPGVLPDTTRLLMNGGTLDVGANSEAVGSVRLRSGSIVGSGLLQAGGFELESGHIGARLGGAGTVLKTTPGVATLGAANSYSGGTRIAEGTLRLQAHNALPAFAALFIDGPGVLDLAGFSATVGTLSGSGTLMLGAGGVLSVAGAPAGGSFSGVIAGAGTIAKVGDGSLTLSASLPGPVGLRVAGGMLDLPNGVVLAGSDLEVTGGTLRTQGFVNRALVVDAGGTVAATGNLIAGDLGGARAIRMDGTLDVGSHVVQLVNGAGASVGGTVLLGDGGRLTAFHQDTGIVLAAGGSVQASGSAAIDGNFVNQGTVHGPTGANQVLTFTDDVTGPGSYTGNISFADGFSPGASPALVSMDNATFDATSSLLMELGLTGHDKLVLSGHLALQGGLLTVALIEGFLPAGGEVFDLFDWASIEGRFGQVVLPTLADGLFWSTASLYTDGTISVAAIPEPQTYALLLAGLALLGFAARRRRAGAH